MFLPVFIFSYIIVLIMIYFGNDTITDLLNGQQAFIRFIELTLPLTIPSLVYFYQRNKDARDRAEKEEEKRKKEEEKQKEEEKAERDKFERSLPFFYVKDRAVFVRSPHSSPVLNVKIELGWIKDDFTILDDIRAKGEICSEKTVYIGGSVDGDEISPDRFAEGAGAAEGLRWFVLSAVTAANDSVYFVYLPCIRTGWHFYRKKGAGESNIVRYIGSDRYCSLAELLAVHASRSEDRFSYRESILNDAAAFLKKGDLTGAFSQLILLARERELSESELLYVLHYAYLMLHQIRCSGEIEPGYFVGNLVPECDFTEKYSEWIKSGDPDFMMQEYLKDLICLMQEGGEVSLNFWLRNVEVYIRDQSTVLNEESLRNYLSEIIPRLAGHETGR